MKPPRGRTRHAGFLLVLALPACPRRARAPSSDAPPQVTAPTDRCALEAARAAVFTPPGTGPLDTLDAACDGHTLAVFTLRGHVLSRSARALTPGARFTPPETLSSGADRLGPVHPTQTTGPLAWRSPIAGLDTPEPEELWVAAPRPAPHAPRRGSTLLPTVATGLGSPVAVAASPTHVTALATVVLPDRPPAVVRHAVPARDDDAETLTTTPPPFLPGELHAYDFVHGVALTREGDPTRATLSAWSTRGERPTLLGRVALHHSHALVTARGTAHGADSLFAAGEFDLASPDGGACTSVGGGLCIRPGPLFLVRSSPAGTTRVDLSTRGLPDTLAPDPTGVALLYVAPDAQGAMTQHAARIALPTGRMRPVPLRPPAHFPAIDRPALVACADELWLTAEVALPRGEAITALPLECLAR